MESGFQCIFLIVKKLIRVLVFIYSASALADQPRVAGSQVSAQDIDTEYFDIGVFAGVVNIEDFSSEPVQGINATFNADERFFLQLNYLQANASLSSFERSQGKLFSGNDRTFQHVDFLVGYNLFQSEHFFSGAVAKLSTFYLVAGIGDTKFGGESGFTYTVGLGYQFALTRDVLLRVDYRDYIYKTNLIGDDKFTNNIQLSAGLSYLF